MERLELFPTDKEFGFDQKSTAELNQWDDGPAYEQYYAFDEYPETESGGNRIKMTFERSVKMPRGLNWFQREDDFLLQAVQEHGKNWIKVAQSVGKLKADPGKCRARYS